MFSSTDSKLFDIIQQQPVVLSLLASLRTDLPRLPLAAVCLSLESVFKSDCEKVTIHAVSHVSSNTPITGLTPLNYQDRPQYIYQHFGMKILNPFCQIPHNLMVKQGMVGRTLDFSFKCFAPKGFWSENMSHMA